MTRMDSNSCEELAADWDALALYEGPSHGASIIS